MMNGRGVNSFGWMEGSNRWKTPGCPTPPGERTALYGQISKPIFGV